MIPRHNKTPKEKDRRAILESFRRRRPVAPEGWLRDDWSKTVFGLPWATRTTSLDIQSVWASKKATVEIHRAWHSGSWSAVTPLTVSLAICDRVLQLNEYARLGRIKYVTFSTWLAEREADIAQTYQDAVAALPVAAPTLAETRRLALLVLAWTYCVLLDSAQDFQVMPEVIGADGGVFGRYAPIGNELDEYGYGPPLRGHLDLDDPNSGDKLIREMAEWEKRNPGNAERVKNMPPPTISFLPPSLVDLPSARIALSAVGKTDG